MLKLSIITVNLNNKEGLQKTIDSVLSQTFKNFEWIVIDGGSTDGSKELIKQCSEHFSYWVSEPDKGIYNAMNKGVKVAKGEYLQFLNSGDWLVDETALERCFSHGFSADIAYGDLFFVHADGKIEKSTYPEHLTFRFLYQYSLGHNASFFKRELFQKDQYDESLKIVSDWAFFIKKVLENKDFEYLDEIVTCFDTGGVSSVDRESVIRERDTVIRELVSDALVRDYNKMDEMQALLNKDAVKKVLEYGNKKKVYRKIITGCLLLIGLVDKCFGRKDD